jgi:hypothetical protein
VIELKCNEVVELVTEYLSRAMSPEDRVRFEQHLFTCPPCTSFLEQMKTVVELSGAAFDNAPRGDDAALAGVFQRWKQRS